MYVNAESVDWNKPICYWDFKQSPRKAKVASVRMGEPSEKSDKGVFNHVIVIENVNENGKVYETILYCDVEGNAKSSASGNIARNVFNYVTLQDIEKLPSDVKDAGIM